MMAALMSVKQKERHENSEKHTGAMAGTASHR
jgi:hypothetical protein